MAANGLKWLKLQFQCSYKGEARNKYIKRSNQLFSKKKVIFIYFLTTHACLALALPCALVTSHITSHWKGYS